MIGSGGERSTLLHRRQRNPRPAGSASPDQQSIPPGLCGFFRNLTAAQPRRPSYGIHDHAAESATTFPRSLLNRSVKNKSIARPRSLRFVRGSHARTWDRHTRKYLKLAIFLRKGRSRAGIRQPVLHSVLGPANEAGIFLGSETDDFDFALRRPTCHVFNCRVSSFHKGNTGSSPAHACGLHGIAARPRGRGRQRQRLSIPAAIAFGAGRAHRVFVFWIRTGPRQWNFPQRESGSVGLSFDQFTANPVASQPGSKLELIVVRRPTISYSSIDAEPGVSRRYLCRCSRIQVLFFSSLCHSFHNRLRPHHGRQRANAPRRRAPHPRAKFAYPTILLSAAQNSRHIPYHQTFFIEGIRSTSRYFSPDHLFQSKTAVGAANAGLVWKPAVRPPR